MLPSYTYIEFKESKYHTNPLLPSSFDRLFAKCTAISISTTKNNYRNLKPTKIHYRNQIPLNCTTYFYHVPCAPALFQSEDLNTPTSDFHHFPAAVHSSQSGPSCWFNMIQQTLALLMDYPPNISLYCQWKLISYIESSCKVSLNFYNYNRLSWWPYSPDTTLNKLRKKQRKLRRSKKDLKNNKRLKCALPPCGFVWISK